ncbi:MAG: 3-deoxy-7-phosphoheptulonate synthase [Firmicutes bacterium]|nr:3-deoxy-7-phosphoheptulonate synthase [Bacillota bacterium]
MIAVLKRETTEKQLKDLIDWLESMNLKVHLSKGDYTTIVGLVGDTTNIDRELLESLDIVEGVKTISEPFKKANRKFHPKDSIVEVGATDGANSVKVGGGHFAVMAGPCSVENPEQIEEVAAGVKAAGASILRGGAFKPRTSPYDFQGLKDEGIQLLEHAKKMTGLPIVTEIMNPNHLPMFEHVDLIQVGARNMQNFELLKELGKIDKPILLKRGLASTLKEWLMSAEYIMAGGNENIILCERGIRTFETYTRNTLDLSAIPMLKELTHLPVIVDPSHATGMARLVKPMALAAVAAGADGLMIEVHNNPSKALCDGAQSLTPDQFAHVMKGVNGIREVME